MERIECPCCDTRDGDGITLKSAREKGWLYIEKVQPSWGTYWWGTHVGGCPKPDCREFAREAMASDLAEKNREDTLQKTRRRDFARQLAAELAAEVEEAILRLLEKAELK